MTPRARSVCAVGAVVVAAFAALTLLVYLLVGSQLAGSPAVTEPWDEARGMTQKIMIATIILGGWLLLTRRALAGARGAEVPREVAWFACVASLPVALTYQASLPGGPVRVALWSLRDAFVAPVELMAPTTVAFVCALITLGARSPSGGET